MVSEFRVENEPRPELGVEKWTFSLIMLVLLYTTRVNFL